MIIPQRIGRYLPLDAQGRIVPDVAPAYILSPWKEAVEDITTKLMELEFVSGVYLRGSVPRGLAQQNASDLDFLCVTSSNSFKLAPFEAELNAYATNAYPFIRGIEIANLKPSRLAKITPPHTRPYEHMLLKTQSLHLAGPDVTLSIASFHVDVNLVSHALWLKDDFVDYQKNEAAGNNVEANRGWIARRIVRAGLEITLNRQPNFTRDLYLCYETFAHFYPDFALNMHEVLTIALNGHRPLDAFQSLITLLSLESRWMAPR